MRTPCIAAVLVVVTCGLSGCRQADGPLLSPADVHKEDDIGDVAKDMLNVVGRIPQGPKELAEDLVKFSDVREAETPVGELSQRLSDVLPGTKLASADAAKLAGKLWQGITAREISARQSKALQDDVKTVLVSAGVSEQNAGAVAAQLAEIQKVTNARPKKWYEVF